MKRTPADNLPAELAVTVAACRRMVSRKALVSAGAALVPLLGVDIAADMALLTMLLNRINEQFGLSESQIEALSPERKALVYKAMTAVGSTLVGSTLTRELVLRLLAKMGVRLTAKQTARWVPVVGQAVSAGIAYTAIRAVCNRHIDDCAKVAGLLRLPAQQPAGDQKISKLNP